MCRVQVWRACKWIDSASLSVDRRYWWCSLFDSTCSLFSARSSDGSAPLYPTFISSQFFVMCSVWSCGVKVLSAYSSATHVAAQSLQAKKASHAHPSVFKVENLTLSSWLIKLEQPSENLHSRKPHARNPHAGNLQLWSTFLSSMTDMYIRTYVHCMNKIPSSEPHVTAISNKCILSLWDRSCLCDPDRPNQLATTSQEFAASFVCPEPMMHLFFFLEFVKRLYYTGFWLEPLGVAGSEFNWESLLGDGAKELEIVRCSPGNSTTCTH